ncbi:MAG TPA: COX15/CtaA family protein [Desulfuromonadaceae bacterium]
MPPMVGGIFYEHGHRMIATFVGALTVILAAWLWKADERRWVKLLGLGALMAVIMQGVLGGLTVLFLLPTPVSVLHATLAQSFFTLTVVIALVTSAGWRRLAPLGDTASARTKRIAVCATVMVLVQLVLGAWMRHSDAGLAILDFPLSYGHVIPQTSPDALLEINGMRIDRGLAPVDAPQVWIHFAHRVGALLTAFLVLWLVIHILRTYHQEPRLREPALILGVLLIMQGVLGALTVWTGKGVEVATTHVALGALLLATSAFLTVRVFGLFALGTQEIRPYAPEFSRP